MISLLGFMSWNDLCNVHLCSGRRNNEGPWVPETGLVMTGSFTEETSNLYKLSREVHTPYQSTCIGFQHFTVKSNDFGAAAISMDDKMRRLILCILNQMSSHQSSGYLVDIG